MKPSGIELEIDELVLHGFARGDRHRIAGAIEQELARLFAEQGVPPSLARAGSIESIDGGAFEAKPHAKPEATGARIARAIYGGLTE
ncbi:MAG TPA: hypothetical protein VE262_08160 [Blastocatellia bacterium]|nr:hypothetical protein [Blastocatellia bacterium]